MVAVSEKLFNNNLEKFIFFKEKELVGAPYEIIKLVQEKNKEILELRKKAYYDHLTGLLNRHGIDLFLDEYFKDGEELSIVLIDLDNLKTINTNSYKNGDKALKIVANNIKKFFSKNKSHKIIARLGGDEFLVISNNKDKNKFISTIINIEKILTDISKKINSFEISITSAFMIGVKKDEIGDTIKQLHKKVTRKKDSKKSRSF